IRTAAPTFISIPKKWIMSFVIDWKLTEFVNSLDLPEDTRARVMALIDDPEIVTDVVPFLLHLQENYSADSSIIDFNTFARKNFNSLEVTGLEYTLFMCRVSQEFYSGISFDTTLACNLVLLSDSFVLTKGVSALAFSSLDEQGDHHLHSVRSEASDHVKQLVL